MVAGYSLKKIAVLETLSTSQAYVGVISKEIPYALNKRSWYCLCEQGKEVLRLDLDITSLNMNFYCNQHETYLGELETYLFCQFIPFRPGTATYPTSKHIDSIGV